MDFSYPSNYRLKSSQDFSYLREDAQRIPSPYFLIYFKQSRLQAPGSRLGISVSKKSGNAVNRNLFKRIIREIFRKHPIRNAGLDLMVVISKKNVPKTFLCSLENKTLFSSSLIKAFGKIA